MTIEQSEDVPWKEMRAKYCQAVIFGIILLAYIVIFALVYHAVVGYGV